MKQPSIGKTIAKIAVGALFIVVGLDNGGDFTYQKEEDEA